MPRDTRTPRGPPAAGLPAGPPAGPDTGAPLLLVMECSAMRLASGPAKFRHTPITTIALMCGVARLARPFPSAPGQASGQAPTRLTNLGYYAWPVPSERVFAIFSAPHIALADAGRVSTCAEPRREKTRPVEGRAEGRTSHEREVSLPSLYWSTSMCLW